MNAENDFSNIPYMDCFSFKRNYLNCLWVLLCMLTGSKCFLKNLKHVGNCTLNVTNEMRPYCNYFYNYTDLDAIVVALVCKNS